MPDDFEDQDWVRTGVASAMLRSLESGNQEALELVGKLMNSSLPNHSKLEYKGLFTKKLVKASVSLGEDVMSLELDAHGGLVASRVHTSRGIALKREEWPMEGWVAALVAALEEKATSDGKAREALFGLIGRAE